VAVDGDLYVRAYHGQGSRWYQAAVWEGAGRIEAAGMTKEVAFEAVGSDRSETIITAGAGFQWNECRDPFETGEPLLLFLFDGAYTSDI
jgi:hypothetical protein